MRLCGISCVLIVIAMSPSSPSVLGQAKSDKDQKGPTLSNVKITSTKQSPVTLEFTVEIAPGKAPLDGLFAGLGTPEALKIVAKRGTSGANLRDRFSAARASLEQSEKGSTLHKGKVVFDEVERVTNDKSIVSFMAVDDKDNQGNLIILEVDFKTGKVTDKKDSSAKEPDDKKPKPEDQPVLSDLTVTSTELSPITIKFTVRMKPGKAAISFDKKSGFWFCFGQPSTIPSMRKHLEEQIKQMRPSVEDKKNVRIMFDMDGPGFVAGSCSQVKPLKDKADVWTGVINVDLKVKDDAIDIPSRSSRQSFKATEMPVSLILWDDDYKVSNELKVVVDLKAGKVVKDVAGEKKKN